MFNKLIRIMNLKGEVTFKVKFTSLGVPAGMYSTAIILHECSEQVYARSMWSKLKDRKKQNFSVEVIEKKISKNDD